MIDRTTILMIPVAAALTVWGCEKKTDAPPTTTIETPPAAEKPPAVEPPAVKPPAQSHDQGSAHTIEADAFGGRQLSVELGSSIRPGGDLHVGGKVVSGPATDAIRMWIGDETGLGSMKAKATVHNGRFHVHVDVPAPVEPDAALWMEITDADGTRHTTSLPLPPLSG